MSGTGKKKSELVKARVWFCRSDALGGRGVTWPLYPTKPVLPKKMREQFSARMANEVMVTLESVEGSNISQVQVINQQEQADIAGCQWLDDNVRRFKREADISLSELQQANMALASSIDELVSGDH